MNQENIRVNSANPIILFAIGSLVLGGSEKQMALLIKHLDQLNRFYPLMRRHFQMLFWNTCWQVFRLWLQELAQTQKQ